MKTFKDLKFKERFGGVSALEVFDNGFEISVVAGRMAYSLPREDNSDPDFFNKFEIAIRDTHSGEFVTRDFLPDLDDDVLGWQSRGQINALMLLIQSKEK